MKINRQNETSSPVSKKLIIIPLLLLTFGISSIAYAEVDEINNCCLDRFAGIFIDSGGSGNQLIDVTGFANWGKPGSVSNYDSNYQGGGILLGKSFEYNNFPLRFETRFHASKPMAQTNQLDPAAGDETAFAEFEQLSSFRLGIEQEFGSGTKLIVNGGLAYSNISNFVIDIDFSQTYPDGIVDPDDSFSDTSSKLGWVIGLDLETPISDLWALRLGGSLFDFGKDTYYVNTSGNNSCGRGGEREPCPYLVHNSLFTAYLALIRKF